MSIHTYERILICTDGTKLSDKAVESGLALAAALDAEVVAFTVLDYHLHSYFEGTLALTIQETTRIEKEWREKAQARLDLIVQKGHTRDVKVSTALGQGAVAEAIIKAAKKHKSDLIVMASHGRKGVARVLLGSETTAVLTHSLIPVLVLR